MKLLVRLTLSLPLGTFSAASGGQTRLQSSSPGAGRDYVAQFLYAGLRYCRLCLRELNRIHSVLIKKKVYTHIAAAWLISLKLIIFRIWFHLCLMPPFIPSSVMHSHFCWAHIMSVRDQWWGHGGWARGLRRRSAANWTQILLLHDCFSTC